MAFFKLQTHLSYINSDLYIMYLVMLCFKWGTGKTEQKFRMTKTKTTAPVEVTALYSICCPITH